MIFLLSCILWVKGDYTTIQEVPLEYGMAQIRVEKSGFVFEADAMEEQMNSMKITHPSSQSETMVVAYQNSLYAKLSIQGMEASSSCEIKKKIQ